MANFVISTATTTAPALATNDNLLITSSGAILAPINLPFATNNVSMNINGTVLGFVFAGSNANISIGETGSMVSSDVYAIYALSGNIVNHGIISGLGTSVDGLALGPSDGTSVDIVNYGTITSTDFRAINNAVSSGTPTTRVVNFGTVSGGTSAYDGSVGFDIIENNGVMRGNVVLGSGADSYLGSNGVLVGSAFGGSGADTLIGGRGDETLNGGDDNDVLWGNGGADRLEGGANDDTLYFDADDLRFGLVSGGTGYDTGYNYDESTPITFAMTGSSIEAFYGSNADEIIVAGSLGGFGAFVRSGGGNDLFDGSGQADNVDGGNGVDVLYGRGGADVLAGGLGGDWLQGGAGADVFDYNAGTDSTVNGQDFIADFFTAEGDKINLDDALTNLGFATATFNTGFGTNASVYVFAQGGASLVQVYTGATLQMQLVVSQASLTASDFVL